MSIEELFDFLIKDYGLIYKHQKFTNCYGGNWVVETHSFYNESGCFTIYVEFQRGTYFYFSSKFSTNYEELSERELDISLIEPEIWNKRERFLFFKNPFWWWCDNKVLKTLAEVLKVHLAKGNDLFGIQV